MIDKYIPQEIELKWQERWEADGLYHSDIDRGKPKHYALTMLPYPSGNLHIGHWYAIAPSDVRARFMRMRGYNVLFPMGFDAFGLPAENAAIKRGIHPHKWTLSNVATMRRQLRTMGTMIDWRREAVSCLPGYYRWTQWFFLRLMEQGLVYREKAPVDFCPKCNTTLAREQVWGEDRHCERCGTPVVKKELAQWFWKITDYADELLDFSDIDWPDRVVTMQTNWIGRSEGANVTFRSEQDDPIVVFTTRPDTLWGATFMVLAPEHPLVNKLTAPAERDKVRDYQQQASRQSEIERLSTENEKTGVFIGAYAVNPVNGARIPIWISDYVMMTYGTGAIMGVPSHDERDFDFALEFGLPIIPVIARPDGQAKSRVGTGTVGAGFREAVREAGITLDESEDWLLITLGQDQVARYENIVMSFLKPDASTEIVGSGWVFLFNDDIVPLDGPTNDKRIADRYVELHPEAQGKQTAMEILADVDFYQDVLFHSDYGEMINSGPFSGTAGDTARRQVTTWLESQEVGEFAVNYRLRDWLVSRQRYWGAPIPIVYCDKCGIVPVPYEDLPVRLPEDAEFLPTGESPLKFHEGFLHTSCPRCGGSAVRETDTMDTFVCSSWYQYAYLSPYYKEGEIATSDSRPFDREEAGYWLPVDVYTGGIEHATMHLIYTRFFTKAVQAMGILSFGEPMKMLRNQGIILGEDNEKMSKSRGNVIAPDDLVQKYGADVVRGYLMFGWRWDQGGPWDSHGIEGVHRWLCRLWGTILEPANPSSDSATDVEIAELRRWTHKTIHSVTEDMEGFNFNTIIARMMEFTNVLQRAKQTPVATTDAWQEAIETLVLLLAPCCPHISEELWHRIRKTYSVHKQPWPAFDAELAAEDTLTLVIQVNGKLRARVQVPSDISEERARAAALDDPNIVRHTKGKTIKKIIYVPGRLVNIVAH
jgi:leucyl-tRNA synthetase